MCCTLCVWLVCLLLFFFFKQKTAYEMRISDWSSDVCSSDLMDNALKGYEQFNWSSRWGPIFWTGLGYKLPPGYRAWSWTVISPAEDQNWTDPAGNLHPVGNGKVSHIWSLRDDGQHYRFNDPWLPRDDSYEMCGPQRGQFRGVNLSASGSTIFTINRYGDLYTRHYDFDLSGDDSLFFEYAYEDQRGVSDPAIQLPTFDWLQQPKIPGAIPQNISMHKEIGRAPGRERVGQ